MASRNHRRDMDLPRLGEAKHHTSLAESIARQIEQSIIDDMVAEGTRLGTKSDLRAHYGVAAGTVNEAVRLLETRGIVSARPGPGGGVFVNQPASEIRLEHLTIGLREGSHTVADCLYVRNALEEPILLAAAEYCAPEDIRELRLMVEHMRGSQSDSRAFLRMNWILHRRIASMSRNAVLRTIYTTLLDTIEREVESVESDMSFEAEENIQIHVQLIDALESGDPVQIREAGLRHAPSIRERLIPLTPS